MRCGPRNLQARRRRWPLRLGLFLIYVLVQYVSSTKVPPPETTTPVLLSSSAQWTSEPPVSSISSTEEEEKATTEEPRKNHVAGSQAETPPKGHGRAAESGTRNQFKKNAENKEATKTTETPPPRQDRNATSTVSGPAGLLVATQPSGERGFCETLQISLVVEAHRSGVELAMRLYFLSTEQSSLTKCDGNRGSQKTSFRSCYRSQALRAVTRAYYERDRRSVVISAGITRRQFACASRRRHPALSRRGWMVASRENKIKGYRPDQNRDTYVAGCIIPASGVMHRIPLRINVLTLRLLYLHFDH